MQVPERKFRTKVSPRAYAGVIRETFLRVIIVRAREAFRGNGNNSRFESSTSLSAFDERAHARSLCTRIDLSATTSGTRHGSERVRIVKDQPIISAPSSAPDFPHHELIGVCVCVCARIYVGGWKEVGGWSLSLSLQISTGETETLNEIIS